MVMSIWDTQQMQYSPLAKKKFSRENVHWISVPVQIGDPIVAPPGESCLKKW